MTSEELACLGIEKLRMRFQNKINTEEYYLSYSGGMDSHLLWWFIKKRLKDDVIKTVSVNTYREHNEIRERLYKYSDTVLYPTKRMPEIKSEYGIPCFSKGQDEFIKRYQQGARSEYLICRIQGLNTNKTKSMFGLNKTARDLLLSGKLHRVSAECCKYTKKEPLKIYEKQTGLKPIIGVRASESILRKSKYTTCVTAKGKFTPLYDFTHETVNAIYEVYGIEKPKIYNHVRQTGCIGCPYGARGGNTERELSLVTPAQRQYAIDSFDESYAILGINTTN